MISFRTFTFIALLFCLILMSSAVNHSLDSEPEESEEVPNQVSNGQSRVRTVYSFARAGEAKCADYHDVCRLHGPQKVSCCDKLVCKVAYGEYHCFHAWEVTS